jgi:hypothetical protein
LPLAVRQQPDYRIQFGGDLQALLDRQPVAVCEPEDVAHVSGATMVDRIADLTILLGDMADNSHTRAEHAGYHGRQINYDTAGDFTGQGAGVALEEALYGYPAERVEPKVCIQYGIGYLVS